MIGGQIHVPAETGLRIHAHLSLWSGTWMCQTIVTIVYRLSTTDHRLLPNSLHPERPLAQQALAVI
jgi:hypothetical protein